MTNCISVVIAVVFSAQTVGVIVRLERESFQVLNNFGKVITGWVLLTCNLLVDFTNYMVHISCSFTVWNVMVSSRQIFKIRLRLKTCLISVGLVVFEIRRAEQRWSRDKQLIFFAVILHIICWQKLVTSSADYYDTWSYLLTYWFYCICYGRSSA